MLSNPAVTVRALSARYKAMAGTLLVLFSVLGAEAQAQSSVLQGSGYRGSSYVPQGWCKYGNTGLNGFLTTGVAPTHR